MSTNFDFETEEISIVQARAMLTQLPEKLAVNNRAVALTRHGKPVLAVMPWELFESILETLDIMGDPEMMAALRQGIKDVQEGNLVPLDEVKASLGIDSSPAS
ncbi:MAG TPA: type II toxin-antitoxin system Phd/YefM family antitoxin [Dehalococcoidia bacterium]|nr:type II toxin-antitoxin system Phd/YefM family antitoxin [Dehalococcoidia bacterium]